MIILLVYISNDDNNTHKHTHTHERDMHILVCVCVCVNICLSYYIVYAIVSINQFKRSSYPVFPRKLVVKSWSSSCSWKWDWTGLDGWAQSKFEKRILLRCFWDQLNSQNPSTSFLPMPDTFGACSFPTESGKSPMVRLWKDISTSSLPWTPNSDRLRPYQAPASAAWYTASGISATRWWHSGPGISISTSNLDRSQVSSA